MGFVDLMREGGMIMYPLLFCSVLVLGITLERFWFFYQFGIQFDQLIKTSKDLVDTKKYNEAKGLAHSIYQCIGIPYLHVFDYSKENWEQVMNRRLSETQISLKKYIWILGTIGTSAPFIGLFGTVVGIIKSFDNMAQTGKAGFTIVAGGLSEALIATAAGIFVAVIAVFFYNVLLTRIKIIQTNFRNKLEDLKDLVEEHGRTV